MFNHENHEYILPYINRMRESYMYVTACYLTWVEKKRLSTRVRRVKLTPLLSGKSVMEQENMVHISVVQSCMREWQIWDAITYIII